MTADPLGLRRVVPVLVVAVEYRGADLSASAGGGGQRVAICEHAYDLSTATLAGHPGGKQPRIAFPARQRGWNAASELARCPACSAAVTAIVHELIRTTLAEVLSQLR
ncbi:MAG: hypothetical protein JWM76_2971 [Pseudonocardiales bacterium]|nr:hypothetical protein [Pseudonocardiales bacterium]